MVPLARHAVPEAHPHHLAGHPVPVMQTIISMERHAVAVVVMVVLISAVGIASALVLAIPVQAVTSVPKVTAVMGLLAPAVVLTGQRHQKIAMYAFVTRAQLDQNVKNVLLATS